MLHVVILCEIGAILYLHFICDLQHFLNEAWETRLKLKVTSEAWQTQWLVHSLVLAIGCSTDHSSGLRCPWARLSDTWTEQKRSRQVGSNALRDRWRGRHAALLHRRNATGDALVLGRLGWQPVSKRGWGGQVAWGVVKHHVPCNLGTCPWGQTCK